MLESWLRLLDARVPENHRSDVAYVALELAELAGRRAEWEKALEGRNVTESTLYRRAVQQGEDRAQVRVTREHLLRVVNARFPGAVPGEYLDLIRGQESYPVLDAWFQAALAASDAEGFIAALRR